MRNIKKQFTPRAVVAAVVLLVLVVASIWVASSRKAIAPSIAPVGQSDNVPATRHDEKVTKAGELTCLPRKDTNGVQDMSCALGLKVEDDEYYALSGGSDQLIGIANAQHILVTGTLSTDTSKAPQFNIAGVIIVQTITKQ